MSESARLLPSLISRALGRLSRICFHRPQRVLAPAVALLIASLWAASRWTLHELPPGLPVEVGALGGGELLRAGGVALALVLLLLIVHLRRAGAVLLVMVPLLVGLAWGYALAVLMWGGIHALTGFAGAVVVMGFGCHSGLVLVAHHQRAQQRERAAAQAVAEVFQSSGGAVLIAHLVSALGCLALCGARDAVLAEIGLVAATGTTMMALAYGLLWPALAGLVYGRNGPQAAEPGANGDNGVGSDKDNAAEPGDNGAGWFSHWAPTTFWLSAVAVLLLAWHAVDLRLDGVSLQAAPTAAMLNTAAPWLLALGVTALLAMALALATRTMAGSTLTLAAGALLSTAGLLALIDLRLHLLDTIALPVLLGMSAHGAIQLHASSHRSRPSTRALQPTLRATMAGLACAALPFAVLLVTGPVALQSLARVALLGLALVALLCGLTMPAALLMVGRGRHGASGGRVRWAELGATVGLSGLSPLAPGTLGAIVAIPLGLVVGLLPMVWGAMVVVAVTVLCHLATHHYLQAGADHDPSEVVADELAGCLIAIFFVPQEPLWIVAAFVMFRLFDIFKPWPVSFFDKKVSGAAGVMGDDVAAGVMAGLGLAAANTWLIGS